MEMNQQQLDDIAEEARIAARMNRPKRCSRCSFSGKVQDFPLTTARGYVVARSWCLDCTREYYRLYAAKRKKRCRLSPRA